MRFDLKMVIGALFCVYGTLLSLYGLVSDPVQNARSLGFNVNLEWGLVLLGFGLCMIFLGRRSNRE